MTSASPLLRSLLVYSVCLPLAVFLGYLMATPMDFTTFAVVGLLLLLLLSPLFLRWHHVWLVAAWNAGAVVFFLPGHPQLWLILAFLSLGISVLQYILNRRMTFLSVPELSRPLIFLAVVVLVTAYSRGGIGLNSLGGETMGGKRYIMLLAAIAGYFAITNRKISSGSQWLYVALFLLGQLGQAVGDLATFVNPSFYFMFLVFPVSTQGITAIVNANAVAGSSAAIGRWMGLGAACAALDWTMLARWGISGIFTFQRLGRLMLFLCIGAIAMFGGYRGIFVGFAIVFAFLFWLEDLWTSPLMPGFILAMIVGGAVLVAFVDRMPMGVQRTLSVLPLPVDPLARLDAQASSEWRIKMWHELLPEIPRYLLLGKGLAMSSAELSAMQRSGAGGGGDEGAIMAGDYHNGPLSVIIPFGLPGVIGFVWLLVAGVRVLHRNYRFGDPECVRLNRFIFAYFLAKVVIFCFVFGGFYSELCEFTGLLGLSVSLNGGMARKQEPAPQSKLVFNRFKLHPSARRPVGA